jgi:hypothetical protein
MKLVEIVLSYEGREMNERDGGDKPNQGTL